MENNVDRKLGEIKAEFNGKLQENLTNITLVLNANQKAVDAQFSTVNVCALTPWCRNF